MKILFTGASSFTGSWFVKELAQAGHEVVACFRSPYASYQGLRKERIDLLKDFCQPVFNCFFGGPLFLEWIAKHNWELFCHHAAEVVDYKNPDFPVSAAIVNNTYNIVHVLKSLLNAGCRKMVLSGSIFEPNEGIGTDHSRAVSPYGLSKGLTADIFRFYTAALGINMGKFVIPNPFGSYEEKRFTSYLMQSWYDKKIPSVKTPNYIRDNVPVTLLAKAYRAFSESLDDNPGFKKINPSFYSESQKAFTDRFAKEMEKRLHFPCPFEVHTQIDFSEPMKRVNTDFLMPAHYGWDEEKAWDDLADYYKSTIR